MVFSRRFPRDVKGSPYPVWEEVYLSADEEKEQEDKQRQDNLSLMKECIADAKQVATQSSLKEDQEDILSIAIALFEKRSSHAVYWKEEAVKAKYDKAFNRGQ